VLTGLAHTALCVDDLDAAVQWYTDVLGLQLWSPPYLMEGDAIERDMGELVPSPVALRAAIVGVHGDAGDRVIEVIEYPNVPPGFDGAARDAVSLTAPGFTHVGLVCDDIDATRATLEARGAVFLVRDTAKIAGLRTTWLRDPWHNVFILMQKRDQSKPYFAQY